VGPPRAGASAPIRPGERPRPSQHQGAWLDAHAGRARQGERDLRPPEVANASVNAGVDTGSVSVTLLADAGVYPDWAKVGASDSAPSDGSTLGETAISTISETAYDDLVGDDDDSDNSY